MLKSILAFSICSLKLYWVSHSKMANSFLGQEVCWDVIAKYDDFKATALDSSAPNGATGFTLNFANGDTCRNNPRKTVLNMICDSDNEVGNFSKI